MPCSQTYAFPTPARLAGIETFPGLTGRKAEYLRALADAALAGRLDAAVLRAMPPEEALAALEQLPGIGGFSAELSEKWSPCRTWVTLLLRARLEDETGEISLRTPAGGRQPASAIPYRSTAK